MSDTGLMVSGMTEPPIRYDVTVPVAWDDGCGPDPAEFAVAAERAASCRNASVMSAHTWEKIISIVAVEAPDRSSAVTVALAVVSGAQASGRVIQPLRGGGRVMRRLVEHGVPVVLVAARAAPQCQMTHAPAVLGSFLCRTADARHPRRGSPS